MSKWVEFIDLGGSASGKTRVWDVRPVKGGMSLGTITWHGPWRQYIFAPLWKTIWNPECLRDVAEFVENQTLGHRAALQQVKVVIP